ncbi:hypothetical protein TELCIR_10341 [Teladorsagia circumcincta]|uniref:Uncharacterized protein n=1 Tax=Teladorsagia circumcincta TaxID=45464 RepID=A0A2G9UCC4_TELCI|nr:hypothetical protein TELCIR_10341 [Teladorsagia circumcincta]
MQKDELDQVLQRLQLENMELKQIGRISNN